MKFRVGDRVQHKTGGPVMVVDEVSFTGRRVTCVWWDPSTNSFVLDAFPARTLDKNDWPMPLDVEH